MNKKEIQILKLLVEHSDWTTATLISAELGCSIRSVKTYITNINDYNSGLIISSRSGYKLSDKPIALSMLNSSNNNPPQSVDERRTWLLSKLLTSDKYFDMDELISQLCISYNTLEKSLVNLKSILSIYELSLKTKNNAIKVIGSERNKRDMLIDLIYDEVQDSFAYSTLYRSLLPRVDVAIIRSLVNSIMQKSRYFLDDYSLTNVVLFIAVSIELNYERENSNDQVNITPLINSQVPPHIYKIVLQIKQEVLNTFSTALSQEDLHDLALLIMTRVGSKDIANDISPDLENLVNDIRDRVYNMFGLELSNSDSITRFSLHLKNLLIRLQNDITLRNPQLPSIKNTYPYIYEIAINIADVIKNHTGLNVPEGEISFLAIYIGIMLDEQKGFETKICAILICPIYFKQHTSLYNRLNSMFSDRLIITDIISSPNDLSSCESEYDFIISTISFSSTLDKVVRIVSFQPSSADLLLINEEIVRQTTIRLKRVFEQDLSRLFIEDFFFNAPKLNNRKQTIEFLADAMFNAGYVNSSFKEKVFEREEIYSSALGNIAMPHPLQNSATQSAIAVAILPESIAWGENNKVNLVLLISISEEDRLLFQDIFEVITEFISDNSNLQLLVKAHTCKEFVELVSSFFTARLNK